MLQTRYQPRAFAQATAVRSFGIGVTGLLSVLSGAALAALLVVIWLAIGLSGGADSFGPGLLAAAALGGYLAVVPPVFAHRTRATTAGATGGWLAAAVVGYGLLWSALLTAL